MIVIAVLSAVVLLLYLLSYISLRKKSQAAEETLDLFRTPDVLSEDRLNMVNLMAYFKFQDEIPQIINGIRNFISYEYCLLRQYPPPVDIYPFTFAVRQQESGPEGLEFGIMHPEAKNTDLQTQLEWFLYTLMKDSIRWHTGKLWNNWRKEDFSDFIAYFARKYAPPEASDLNKVWESNVRKYYVMFRKE